MKNLGKIIMLIGCILWIILGGFIYLHLDNQEIVHTWAATTGVLFILIIGLEIKHKEDKEDLE